MNFFQNIRMKRFYCKVIAAGVYTTIQDQGRLGWRHRGVPLSGPMDVESFDRANSLLGNQVGAASLEITLMGPTLLFNDPCWVVLSGATIAFSKNNEAQMADTPVFFDLGDVLRLGKMEKGARAYLAFMGGLQGPQYLDSRAHFYPISPQGQLIKGEILEFLPHHEKETLPSRSKLPPLQSLVSDTHLEVVPGIDWAVCPNEVREALKTQTFEIGSNNRMGYRLQGSLPKTTIHTMSGLVEPGTVQLTPGGNLLIAMQDGQVTGGYVRILRLEESARNFLAQQRTGKQLRLQLML